MILRGAGRETTKAILLALSVGVAGSGVGLTKNEQIFDENDGWIDGNNRLR